MNRTEINENVSRDFFPYISQNNPYKIIFLVISIFGILVGPPALYSAVWFEKYGSDNKRTLINMLFSMTSWTCIGFIIFVQIPETLRYIYGLLPYFICYTSIAMRGSFVCMFLLYIDASIITRFIFIFCLNNPAAFNDDFWFKFICIWIQGASLISQWTWHFLATYQPLSFYICTGEDPDQMLKNRPKVYGIVELFSLALNLLLYLKIYRYKKRSPIQPQTQGRFVKGLILRDVEKQSITTLANNALGILYFGISMIVAIKINNTKPEDLNKYPNNLLAHYRSLVTPSLGIFLIILTCFLKQKYRKAIYDEVEKLVSDLCCKAFRI
jgi:hypothetical protein